MHQIDVDTRQWPLLRVAYPVEPIEDGDMRAYLGRVGSYAAAGARFGTVSDMSRMRQPPSAAQAWIFSEWLRMHGQMLRRASVANAIVADAAVVRAVISTAYWWHRDEPSFRLFDDVAEATAWCAARLARAGLSDSGVPPTAPPVSVPGAPPAGAATFDLLDEPVFLVDERGAVEFANRAARMAFRDPPPWLEDAVSHDKSDWTVPARVGRLSSADGSLFVVIPHAGAPLPDLPPSLDRIARLLCRGLSDKEIAQQTDLTLTTVRTYVRRLYQRAGVHSRSELVHRWYGRRAPSTTLRAR